MNPLFKICLITLIVINPLSSCSKDDAPTTTTVLRTKGIFKILHGDTTLEMNGVIGSSSLNDFNTLYTSFPTVTTINIKDCDGSMDDETNLQLSTRVHQLGINIHLLENGLIASGGVDFFLAGIQRTKGNNTRVGVHSWSDGNGTQATDFAIGHAYHLPYINYYISVGFTQQLAEDFYYYTINAATADNIHWMTDAEISTYNILTQ
ncbi:MAG: alpha/beta hydrolase [Flavobacteriaceae bacterium]|nr:alpha/beta hydrolase [Flavobacteriaceae bacterium]